MREHGGLQGIRDNALLDSALARPRFRFHYSPESDIAAFAASYAFGIIRNHPFIDGNKRTAAVACELFLELNGVRIRTSDAELYSIYLDLATGTLDEDAFAAWLRNHLETQV